MNYKELKKEYNMLVNYSASPQLNKNMLIDIMHYLESQHKATDKRTTEYMDGKDDKIKELNKALSVAYEDNENLVKANKMLRRSNEELVKDIKVLEGERDVLQRAVDVANARNRKMEEINEMIKKKDAILILSDDFSFSE